MVGDQPLLERETDFIYLRKVWKSATVLFALLWEMADWDKKTAVTKNKKEEIHLETVLLKSYLEGEITHQSACKMSLLLVGSVQQITVVSHDGKDTHVDSLTLKD